MKRNTLILILTCCGFCAISNADDSLIFVSRTMLTGYPWGLAKRGNYLYVPNRGTISIVDITNPNNPIFIKNHDPLTNAFAVYIVDTIMYCRGGSGFVTLNISNPINPQNLSWTFLSSSSDSPFGISVVNNKCYIACGPNGVMIYNVTSPALPESLGTYNTPGSAMDICIKDSLAYIADYSSLQIINIKRPDSCFQVGSVDMHWGCVGIAIHGNYAYCAAHGDFGVDGRLVVVNISNPANPVAVDSIYNIMGNPITAYYANNRIYSIAADYSAKKGRGESLPMGCNEKADIEGGLRVFNITKPDSIFYTCGYNTFSDPRDAIADSQYVYIADQDSGLIILRHNHYAGIQSKPNEMPTPKYFYSLGQNYPNPFWQATEIKYQLSKQDKVSLNIYNINGQLVKVIVNQIQKSGYYTVSWDGRDGSGRAIASGVYVYRLCAGINTGTGRMILLK